MSETEKFSLTFFGFFIFLVLVIRVSFFLSFSINSFTFLVALILYASSLLALFREKIVKTLFLFSVSIFLFAAVAAALSFTYDTSWDGQGYQQTAVIALAQGWNPIYEKEIDLEPELPSEIFAQSYPSALWEIEASIYKVFGKINSAKVVNVAMAIVSAGFVFSAFRKMKISKFFSIVTTALIIFSPLFTLQLFSFMQDGFGYQLVLVATASLVIFALDKNSMWAGFAFVFSVILLASTKYSHLPPVLILGVIWGGIFINRFLNKEYLVDSQFKKLGVAVVVIAMVFAWLPYGRNALFYKAPFYPTNVPELIGSVTYNNLPHNLQGKSKVEQFFYGIYSRSQTVESGDTRSETNLAEFKVPFTFSLKEVEDAAGLYNNRVGAAGPLFSGIVTVAVIFVIILSFKAKSDAQKYSIYGVFFAGGLVVTTSLVVPTPNLLRYVGQVQLLPIIFSVPLLATFGQRFVKVFVSLILVLLIANNFVYGFFVMQKNVRQFGEINAQFRQMRESGRNYPMKAQHFYSSYIILEEQKVKFTKVKRLGCSDVGQLVASSTTTQFCKS